MASEQLNAVSSDAELQRPCPVWIKIIASCPTHIARLLNIAKWQNSYREVATNKIHIVGFV